MSNRKRAVSFLCALCMMFSILIVTRPAPVYAESLSEQLEQTRQEKKDLEEIAEVVKEKDLFVISDEIYAELTYKEKHVSIASLPGMKERTILINGFSKAYAMTGWRLGYACAPAVIMEQMIKIHQFAIMCAPTTSQYAAVEALRNGDDDVAQIGRAHV